MMKFKIFATCPVYLEDLLEEEILQAGGSILKRSPGGHMAECTLEELYTLLLWSRSASRILLHLQDFECNSQEDVYTAARGIEWDTVMLCSNTVACSCTVSGKSKIPPKSASLKSKDGLVDYWRDKTGDRPNVQRDNPDIAVHVHIHNEEGTLYLDLAGEGLHKRGYRLDAAKAALRENTAAAILSRAGWPRIAGEGGTLIDPMCGSGTLLIEAAFMAVGIAPRMHRSDYGFFHWLSHDPDLWETVFDKAEEKWKEGISSLPQIVGYDNDKTAIAAALQNIKRAGLEGLIHLEKKDLKDFRLTEKMKSAPGLLVTNPPYGQRIGEKGMLHSLYRNLGDIARDPDLKDWHMSVISDDESLLRSIGLKADRKNRIMNGPIKCSLYHYTLFGSSSRSREEGAPVVPVPVSLEADQLTPEAEQFQNRLKKNLKQFRKWKKREGISCYRLYDADLPNFNFAVDFYEDKWIHVQEYAAPSGIDENRARKRLHQAVAILSSLLNLPENAVYIKRRKRQRGKSQYGSSERAGDRYLINEGDCRFWVNFSDYLDTGIFLDHRNVRKYIHDHSEGKTFLNLYCYTGTASVMAAAGGASRVSSVDTSATYLTWARDNFLLNKFNPDDHRFIREDVQQWLGGCKDTFDMIFMDPPTFSNSKSRQNVMQVQEDHTDMIHKAMNCLNKEGVLIFSNNYRRFEMDPALEKEYSISEESSWTGSPDFARKGASHRCWFISHKEKG